jgi:dTDP-4-dehydrorhamnose 3,5-epimerase
MGIEIIETNISGIYIIKLAAKDDERGYFLRTYDRDIFARYGLQTEWVQENQSMSVVKSTLRGLHFQTGEAAETKLVRVLSGSIIDVAVDIRKDSPTFGQHVSIELSAQNQTALYISRGFAHGFCTLAPDSVVSYKVDNFYNPALEAGLLWSDPSVNIQWPFTGEPSCVSGKDSKWPLLKNLVPVEPANWSK